MIFDYFQVLKDDFYQVRIMAFVFTFLQKQQLKFKENNMFLQFSSRYF